MGWALFFLPLTTFEVARLQAYLRKSEGSLPIKSNYVAKNWCLWRPPHTLSGRRWEYDALSMRWEYDILSATRWEYDTLSACWEHHTLSRQCWEHDALSMHWGHDSLSTACWEYDTLSAIWSGYHATITAVRWAATKNNWRSPIYDFGQQRLNGGADWSAAKDGQVCHTSNRLLVGHWRRRALWWLLFNSSVVGWSVGCWSLVVNKGSWVLGGIPWKGKVCWRWGRGFALLLVAWGKNTSDKTSDTTKNHQILDTWV